ncbi:hypothetical protein J4470_01870 [Candidatus Woesearchaeota archaeon]|nr:hypothetical protein [Candidatus Woesearchaeota archaeon]
MILKTENYINNLVESGAGGGMVAKAFFETEVSETEKLRQLFEATLKGIREEFEDHLESINDNTNETQANYEYISKVDEKLNKLIERFDQMESWISRLTGVAIKEEEEETKITLSEQEKRVFLVIYTASEKEPVTYEKLAESLGENDFIIRGYVTNMLEKGVPIRKQYLDRQVFLSLDNEFKERQAKHNILGINQKTVKEFFG